MLLQGKVGCSSLNSVVRSDSNPILMDALAESIRAKDLCSSADELAPKVRKPYTITKQRERWTEDEHKRFLEALKLYGRAWRRIEEHIGTKTAVQIRSHAQKFFSKVVRDAAGGGTASVEPIEIPPPRPKRKPVHPYPRKLGHSSHKCVAGSSPPQERSPSPISSFSGQENRSPTSVLSVVVGRDAISPSASNLPNLCTSPDSSASGLLSPLGQVNTEQENQYGSPRSSETFGFATPVANSPTKLDVSSEHCMCSEGSSSVEAPPTSLKLFGRTVVVAAASQMPSSSSSFVAGSTPAINNDDMTHQKNAVDDETEPGSRPQRDFFGIPCESGRNPWPCGVPQQMIYCTPFPPELANVTEATMASLPWWAFYGGVPCPLIHPYNINPQQESLSRHPEDSDDRNTQKETTSMTGSCTAAVGDAVTADKKTDPVNSGRATRPSVEEKEMMATVVEDSAFTRKRFASGNQTKGFVPYRRCLAERQVDQLQMEGEERQCQRIRLCL